MEASDPTEVSPEELQELHTFTRPRFDVEATDRRMGLKFKRIKSSTDQEVLL